MYVLSSCELANSQLSKSASPSKAALHRPRMDITAYITLHGSVVCAKGTIIVRT